MYQSGREPPKSKHLGSHRNEGYNRAGSDPPDKRDRNQWELDKKTINMSWENLNEGQRAPAPKVIPLERATADGCVQVVRIAATERSEMGLASISRTEHVCVDHTQSTAITADS